MMGALHDGRTVKFDSYNLCSYYTCNDSVVCQFEYKTKILLLLSKFANKYHSYFWTMTFKIIIFITMSCEIIGFLMMSFN